METRSILFRECSAGRFHLQRRGMFPLVAAVGMTRTTRPRHDTDGTEIRAAVFARVAVFLSPLVEFMFAPVASRRMPGTGLSRQRLNAAETRSAMFAIESCHFPFPFLLVVWIASSTVERRGDLLIANPVPSFFRHETSAAAACPIQKMTISIQILTIACDPVQPDPRRKSLAWKLLLTRQNPITKGSKNGSMRDLEKNR